MTDKTRKRIIMAIGASANAIIFISAHWWVVVVALIAQAAAWVLGVAEGGAADDKNGGVDNDTPF